MAKLSQEEQEAISQGFAEGERCQRAYGKAAYWNPFLWSSRMWESFEFGYFLQEEGHVNSGQWERGRGNTYRNPDGFTFKLEYGRGKNSFGICRLA